MITNSVTGQELVRHNGEYGEKISWSIEFNDVGEAVKVVQSGGNDEDPDSDGLVLGGSPDDFNPVVDDPEWPGQYAVSTRVETSLVVNIRYDSFPSETFWSWEKLQGVGTSDTFSVKSWETRDSGTGVANQLVSYSQDVDTGLYRLRVDDSLSDGSCCLFGFGYFTITDSSQVVWESLGDFERQLETYIWVDGGGKAKQVIPIDVPGVGSVVVVEDDDGAVFDSTTTSGAATITLVP